MEIFIENTHISKLFVTTELSSNVPTPEGGMKFRFVGIYHSELEM